MDTYQEIREEKLEDAKVLNKEVFNKLMVVKEVGESDSGYNSDADEIQIVNFDHELKYIKQLKGVDIVFIVDCTASIAPYLIGIKRLMRKLIWDASKTLSQYLIDEDDLLQVGLVQYRDHPPQCKSFTTKVFDLTSDIISFKEEVKRITVSGGGDDAEAVLDGMNEAVNTIKWRGTSEKFIYHILDAPPHGSEFHIENQESKKEYTDEFKNGCPCGLEYEDILLRMREMEIQYNIIKLNNHIDQMISLFQERLLIDIMEHDFKPDDSKAISQSD
jgi:hypothetical protein